jgi:hypothetical protein
MKHIGARVANMSRVSFYFIKKSQNDEKSCKANNTPGENICKNTAI